MQWKISLSLTPRFWVTVTLLATSFMAFAQPNEMISDSNMSHFLESVRTDPKMAGRPFGKSPNEKEYAVLQKYFDDSNFIVRQKALTLACQSAVSTSNTAIRQNAVEKILEHIFDEDAKLGIDGSLLHVFLEEHYSQDAKVLLGKQVKRAFDEFKQCPPESEWENLDSPLSVRKKMKRLNDLILCVGYSKAKEHMDLLADIKKEFGQTFENLDEKYKQNGQTFKMKVLNPWVGRPAWYALLARAMMGSKEDVTQCIQLIEGYPDYECIQNYILPDISRIDQPEITEYLFKSLDSTGTYFGGRGQTLLYRDSVLRVLLERVADDEIKKQVNIQSPDAILQMKDYVQKNAGGDPKKLRVRDIHKEQLDKFQKKISTYRVVSPR